MPMTTEALRNRAIFSLDRRRHRFASERVAEEENSEEEPAVEPASSGSITAVQSNDDGETADADASLADVDLEEGRAGVVSDEEEEDDDVDLEELPARLSRTTVTLAELEEERELARRRSSACVLFAVFILFRLWVAAIQSADFGLLLLCLVGTSWTARWIRHSREQEEELDRRIANYLENSEPGTTEVDRNDLRMLSFQAQLALAIMESQRQMMQGGYGHPEGGDSSPGVGDEVSSKWDRFSYKTVSGSGKNASSKGDYGSVAQEDSGKKVGLEEAPHCSICLSEYEDGEELVKLPCSHLYHDECISSWTANHTRCPLCNLDLSSIATEATGPEDSIV